MLRKRFASMWQNQRLYILLAGAAVLFLAVYVLLPENKPYLRPQATVPALPPGLARLTNDLSGDTAPVWSPDGTLILYHSLRNRTQATLRVMRPDGSDSRQIAAIPRGVNSLTWSPDGTRLLFSNGDIYSLAVDSAGSMTQLTRPGEGVNTEPSWSPDGRTIAFISDRAGTPDVYLLRSNDPRPLRLTDNRAWTQYLSWSPDGRLLLYTSTRDGNIAIFTLDVECILQRGPGAGCTTRLTSPSIENREPVWSPDGQRIAFTSLQDGNLEIYVMNADGSNPTRLTHSPRVDWLPKWSPNGEYIAFLSSPNLEDGARNDIYIVRPDGTGLRQLTDDGLAHQMAWSPDGRRIAFVTHRDSNLALCSPCNTEIYMASLGN